MLSLSIFGFVAEVILTSALSVTLKQRTVATIKETLSNLRSQFPRIAAVAGFSMGLNGLGYLRQTLFQLTHVEIQNNIALHLFGLMDITCLYALLFFWPIALTALASYVLVSEDSTDGAAVPNRI